MTKYRTGTIIPVKEGTFRIERIHQRTTGPTYDTRRSDGHFFPELLEGMIDHALREGARFQEGDQALWRNRPCRVLARGWNVQLQSVRYSIQLDERTLTGIPDHELSTL